MCIFCKIDVFIIYSKLVQSIIERTEDVELKVEEKNCENLDVHLEGVASNESQ